MDLPFFTRVELPLVVIDVADDLRNAVEVGKPPVQGETDGSAAFRADKVPEKGRYYRMGLLPISTEEKYRVDVRAPTRKVVRMLEDGRHPGGVADPVANTPRPKWEYRYG